MARMRSPAKRVSCGMAGTQYRMTQVSPRTTRLQYRMSRVSPRTTRLQYRMTQVSPRTTRLQYRMTQVSSRTTRLQYRMTQVSPRTMRIQYRTMRVSRPTASFCCGASQVSCSVTRVVRISLVALVHSYDRKSRKLRWKVRTDDTPNFMVP